MSTSVHFEGPGELPALNCVEPAAGNESGQLAAAIPMRTMALQGCSCGSGHGSCSCGTKAKTDQTILVLGLGTLEAEFRSDSQVRYFREHGPFPEFDPSDQREIGKILIATRYRPRQVLFVPPYITWASELNWYLRVHLPRKLLIRPCAPWAELKYRGLSYFLAGEPDPSIPVGPTPAPAPGGVGDPQARDYDPIYDEAGDVAQIGHGPHRPHHDFGPDVPQPEGVHGHPIPADPFKGFGIPILPDLVKRYVLIAGYGKKGANLTVVDPVVEGLYELTIFELAITIYLEQPTMSKQTFTRIVSSLRFLFAKYPNEGTTDEGRAINAALLRGINFILSVILESGPDWELRTLSAAATQGAEPSDRIWDVTVTFVNTKNTFTSSIAIVLQMDVTDVLPSMIGVYQTQGTES